ncbi:MAG: hypothetical protein RL456_3559, partial [Pseudomonadota bacterium]
MPLPKPPAKRGTVLDPSAFEAQAAPKPARRAIATPAAEASSALELQPPPPAVAAPPVPAPAAPTAAPA